MIYFETIGPQDGQPLLFIHGLGAGAKQTTSALTSLDGRRVIAPDMPGHGKSLDFDPADFSFDFFADRVIELMDHLGLETTDLGGLSMGSGVTLNLSLRYPERIAGKKLILLRPSWMDSPQPPHLELVARVHAGMGENDRDFQELLAKNPPVAKSIAALFGTTGTEVLERMWRDCPFGSLADLERIKSPALVLSSPRDDLHPLEVAERIAKHLKIVHTAVLPARYDEPEAYQISLNQQINQFLK